ncbi:unnamed protein product [Acanthoscelides obtectus]|uniref:Uncharacterized protein n=1 Tax=Acanthoscelides obtectus TaxID=200917 RepID=A0A9P0LH34_ACAOB|nr:unnamed protein product [Acanthoscelides obtectus]CAK1640325.1 hypothetical protein AOBTE_LOCUS11657 [Acanthoscelides obtectus]
MTPPVPQQPQAQNHQQQVNFSGDSQDSSKGYTSISVREPLANIIAQTKEINIRKREMDPHYSTVSDDSDDVYTTIPDSNGDATASRIPLTVEAEINAPPSTSSVTAINEYEDDDEAIDELYEPPPGNRQPHPGGGGTVAAAPVQAGSTAQHSRQASSSSSVTILGSPKPEKRQANSPLPPPPTACSFDFHAAGDKPQISRNLDDLYAKVHKTKKDEANGDSSNGHSDRSTLPGNNIPIKADVESKEIKLRKEHNYETLRKPRRTSDPGYEKIKGNEEPGYASINGPESISSSDPGYEVLKDRLPSESDPNYEELRHRTSNASDCSGYSRIKEKDINDGYSVVNKRKTKLSTLPAYNADNGAIDEPNYESMPTSEPNYSALKSNGSESDPNYETVDKHDPNYESVDDLIEPPYERLDEDLSKTSSDISGYERIRRKGVEANDNSEGSAGVSKSLSERTEPPYEQLNNDTEDSDVPGYERIKSKTTTTINTLSPNSSGSSGDPLNSNEIMDEDSIIQV